MPGLLVVYLTITSLLVYVITEGCAKLTCKKKIYTQFAKYCSLAQMNIGFYMKYHIEL